VRASSVSRGEGLVGIGGDVRRIVEAARPDMAKRNLGALAVVFAKGCAHIDRQRPRAAVTP